MSEATWNSTSCIGDGRQRDLFPLPRPQCRLGPVATEPKLSRGCARRLRRAHHRDVLHAEVVDTLTTFTLVRAGVLLGVRCPRLPPPPREKLRVTSARR